MFQQKCGLKKNSETKVMIVWVILGTDVFFVDVEWLFKQEMYVKKFLMNMEQVGLPYYIVISLVKFTETCHLTITNGKKMCYSKPGG